MEARTGELSACNRKDDRTDKIKIAILLNLLGNEGLEIYNTFKLESKANFSEVLQKFEEYCSPRQNVVYERYKFFSRVQLEGQTFETCHSAKDSGIHVRVCRARKWIDSTPHPASSWELKTVGYKNDSCEKITST
ncbi:transposon Ty3-G Gag-Pol polyprotein [Trichonephila clavipes]|nr:transposon Ty3-G Gag-Pol polyprotein [Trichonephila clavipes]